MDLGTEWRSRRWRKLLNLIDHLPRTSAFVEAMSSDEELAVELLKRPEGAAKAQRRMSEWTPETELLSAVVDRLAELIQTIAASHGARPHRIVPAPRPVTATERVRDRQRARKHRSIVARVLPHKAEQYQQQDNTSTGGERPPS